MTVRVRFAPSPTGEPHIGNIRTTVFNWLFARQHGGQFILRIEDTDQRRYTPGGVRAMMEGLRWLGLDWDEGPTKSDLSQMTPNEDWDGAPNVGGPYGPYIQSQRLPLYKEYAEQLVTQGQAYRCDCTPGRLEKVRQAQLANKQPLGYDRHCRSKRPGEVDPNQPHVIRLAVPLTGTTTLHDLIRGETTWDNSLIDDQVLIKSDGFPTYHLGVVVDDYLMKITHIIRGDDWIPSTPKHILLYQAFGWDMEMPIFAHVPLVRGTDGGKLSKRHGATSITEFRKDGFLPEALFNFLALLGWAPGEGDEQEVFSRDELVQRFDLEHVNKAPAVFSYDKLDWFNGVYIRSLSPTELMKRLMPFMVSAFNLTEAELRQRADVNQIAPLVQERLKRLIDIGPLVDFLFADEVSPNPKELVGKKMTAEQTLAVLNETINLLEKFEPFEAEPMEQALRELAERAGLKPGPFFTPIRVAVTGKTVSPPLFGSIVALGQKRTIERLKRARQLLGG
jgi:glutamyl-tRNA synthetase